jgi:hypothetical protein
MIFHIIEYGLLKIFDAESLFRHSERMKSSFSATNTYRQIYNLFYRVNKNDDNFQILYNWLINRTNYVINYLTT